MVNAICRDSCTRWDTTYVFLVNCFCVSIIERCVTVVIFTTPTKTTSKTFAMLHPTPKINRTRRAGANRTTRKAAVLTSPAYRRSLSDKLESRDNNKKTTTTTTTTARRHLSKAKKVSPATEKIRIRKSNLKLKPPVVRNRSA